MAYQIVWTAEADNDFYAIISYLKEHWSNNASEKFAIRIMKKLERIAEMPYNPRFTSLPNVQMIMLDKKMFYFLQSKTTI